jgi:protein TonB
MELRNPSTPKKLPQALQLPMPQSAGKAEGLHDKKGLVLAIILHISFAFLGLLSGWKAFHSEPQGAPDFIFEMASPEAFTEAAPSDALPEIILPEIVAPEPMIEEPDVPIEEAKPEVPPQEEVIKPPKPDPIPDPKPQEVVKKVKYEDFLKKNPKLAEKPKAKPKPTKKANPAPKATAAKPEAKAAPKKVSQNPVKGEGSGPSASVLAAFHASLLRKIDSAWLKPIADITEGLVTIVEFAVAPNGQISQVSVVQSSGNAAADRSVLDAFARVGNAGKPPHDNGGTYRITFRLNR